MNPFSHLTTTEFRAALTPATIRTGMIIQTALASGAVLFFGAIMLVAFSPDHASPTEESLQVLIPLTAVSVVFLVTALVVGSMLYHSRFSESNLQNALSVNVIGPDGRPHDATLAERAVNVIRTAMLIRTALLEGASFFGLAGMMIAATNGSLFTIPWVWVNVVPLVVLIAFVVLTFPTPGRLEEIFETQIKRS